MDSIEQEVAAQLSAEQEAMKEELMALIKQSVAGIANAPSLGTRSGNCIACGRNSSFQPMQMNSPSPAEASCNRISRRKSTNVGHKFKSSEGIMQREQGLYAQQPLHTVVIILCAARRQC